MTPRYKAAAALLVSAVACSKTPKRQPEGCDAAIARGMELSVDEVRRLGTTPQQREQMQRLVLERCRADHWPAAVTSCLVQAADEGSYQMCMARLSLEDSARLTDMMVRSLSTGHGAHASGGATGQQPAASR